LCSFCDKPCCRYEARDLRGVVAPTPGEGNFGTCGEIAQRLEVQPREGEDLHASWNNRQSHAGRGKSTKRMQLGRLLRHDGNNLSTLEHRIDLLAESSGLPIRVSHERRTVEITKGKRGALSISMVLCHCNDESFTRQDFKFEITVLERRSQEPSIDMPAEERVDLLGNGELTNSNIDVWVRIPVGT